MRTANNVLCGALALAAVINIVTGPALSVDFLLSYYLTVVLFYTESYNLVHIGNPEEVRGGVVEVDPPEVEDEMLDSYEKTYKLHPDLSLIAQNLFFGSYSVFGVWFWQVGVGRTEGTGCGDLGAVVFLFGLRGEGWITGASVISGLLGSVFIGIFLVHVSGIKKGMLYGPVIAAAYYFGVCSGYSPYLHISWLLAAILRPAAPRGLGRVGVSPRVLFYVVHYCIINLVGPIVSIVSVERMIRANRLTTPGIGESAGQMIALFTGICSMLLAGWESWIWWRSEEGSSGGAATLGGNNELGGGEAGGLRNTAAAGVRTRTTR